ncbi:MAG: hypothetical protein IPN77_30470 [Sandaracinaceae bacterium]|nr:hypothetical protein [Sandaracinaceae bacterium]
MLGLVVVQLVPIRIHIDTLGVRRVRGLVPWLHYLDPPETFRSVRLDVVRFRREPVPPWIGASW